MTGNDDRFDENLERMFKTAFDQPNPAFQDRLVSDVLAEVAAQRKLEQAQPWWRFRLLPRLQWRSLALAGGGAAVLVIAVGLWVKMGSAGRSVARVNCIYGLVAVQNNGALRTVSEAVDLRPGQRVRTRTGSKALILLPDQTQLLPDPRTSFLIARTRFGPRIVLEQGNLSIEAAKQPPGKAISIEASGAHVKVLGTKLEVRVVEKPSGARQTRVHVLSGKVEMESGGRKVTLSAGTEGVANEGQPPERFSDVFEVNELIRLLKGTGALPGQSGRAEGLPAIIDFTTSTVWAVVPAKHLIASSPNVSELKLKFPAFRAKAYTLEGTEIPSVGAGQLLRLDVAATGSGAPEYLIVKVPGVDGLLKTTGEDHYECEFAGSDSPVPYRIQLHLPASARLENAPPALVGTAGERDKLIVTVEAAIRLPEIYE